MLLLFKKIISSSLIIFLISIFLGINNNVLWYYDKYSDYKKIGDLLMETPYKEYHNYKYNELYKKTSEYKQLKNIVKIDNTFDLAAKDLEKKILLKKNNLINKIKEKNIEPTWEKDIDTEISRLDNKWRYLVVELSWNLITISDNDYIYLYKHKIIGNVDLIWKILKVFNKFKDNKWNIDNPESFKKELFNLFETYKLKYKEIKWYWVKSEIIIGKNFNKKTHQKELFFVSKWFSTPFLEKNYETKHPWKVYLWKYLTDDDIKYTFNIRDSQKIGSDIFVKNELLNDTIYLWMVSNKSKILSNTLLNSKIDLYIYQINRNPYEYFILLLSLILWLWVGLMLSNNFIINYRNNFKRIPEEL